MRSLAAAAVDYARPRDHLLFRSLFLSLPLSPTNPRLHTHIYASRIPRTSSQFSVASAR